LQWGYNVRLALFKELFTLKKVSNRSWFAERFGLSPSLVDENGENNENDEKNFGLVDFVLGLPHRKMM